MVPPVSSATSKEPSLATASAPDLGAPLTRSPSRSCAMPRMEMPVRGSTSFN